MILIIIKQKRPYSQVYLVCARCLKLYSYSLSAEVCECVPFFCAANQTKKKLYKIIPLFDYRVTPVSIWIK